MTKQKKVSAHSPHPSHQKEVLRLRRVRGQIDGIEKMIQEHRYCPEIIHQIRAVRSALKSLEIGILESHMKGCVSEAMQSKQPIEIDKKIQELMKLFSLG